VISALAPTASVFREIATCKFRIRFQKKLKVQRLEMNHVF